MGKSGKQERAKGEESKGKGKICEYRYSAIALVQSYLPTTTHHYGHSFYTHTSSPNTIALSLNPSLPHA